MNINIFIGLEDGLYIYILVQVILTPVIICVLGNIKLSRLLRSINPILMEGFSLKPCSNVHINKSMCRTHDAHVAPQGQGQCHT